jgi:hypothetical protein
MPNFRTVKAMKARMDPYKLVGDWGRELLKPPSTGGLHHHFDSRYIMPYSENTEANRLYMNDVFHLRCHKLIKAELLADLDEEDDSMSEVNFGVFLLNRTVGGDSWCSPIDCERAGDKGGSTDDRARHEKLGRNSERVDAELVACEREEVEAICGICMLSQIYFATTLSSSRIYLLCEGGRTPYSFPPALALTICTNSGLSEAPPVILPRASQLKTPKICL